MQFLDKNINSLYFRLAIVGVISIISIINFDRINEYIPVILIIPILGLFIIKFYATALGSFLSFNFLVFIFQFLDNAELGFAGAGVILWSYIIAAILILVGIVIDIMLRKKRFYKQSYLIFFTLFILVAIYLLYISVFLIFFSN